MYNLYNFRSALACLVQKRGVQPSYSLGSAYLKGFGRPFGSHCHPTNFLSPQLSLLSLLIICAAVSILCLPHSLSTSLLLLSLYLTSFVGGGKCDSVMIMCH